MRFQATLDLLFQLVVSDLKGVNFRSAKCEQETRAVQTGDLSGPRLRYNPAGIPLDRRRQPELTPQILVRAPLHRVQIVGDLYTDGFQFPSPIKTGDPSKGTGAQRPS
jgi:hypothetical protein